MISDLATLAPVSPAPATPARAVPEGATGEAFAALLSIDAFEIEAEVKVEIEAKIEVLPVLLPDPEVPPEAIVPDLPPQALPLGPMATVVRMTFEPLPNPDLPASEGSVAPLRAEPIALDADTDVPVLEGPEAVVLHEGPDVAIPDVVPAQSPLPLRDSMAPEPLAEGDAPPMPVRADPVLATSKPLAAPPPQRAAPEAVVVEPIASFEEVLPETAAPDLAELPSLQPRARVDMAPPPAAPEVARPAPPPLVRNVLERISEVEVREGTTTLRLSPQGLGLLEFDLSRMADGRLHLAIRAENPMVLEALRSDGGALAQFMGEKGFDLSGGQPDLDRYQPPQPEHAEADPLEDSAPERAQVLGERLDILT